MFRKLYAKLHDGIQVDLDPIARKLYSAEVISLEIRNKATQVSLVLENRASTLLNAIEERIRISRSVFWEFLKILEVYRKNLATELREEFEKFKNKPEQSDGVSEDPDLSMPARLGESDGNEVLRRIVSCTDAVADVRECAHVYASEVQGDYYRKYAKLKQEYAKTSGYYKQELEHRDQKCKEFEQELELTRKELEQCKSDHKKETEHLKGQINRFTLPVTSKTRLEPGDLGVLKVHLRDVAPCWVEIADQLGMQSEVDMIRRSPDNTKPYDFLRNLLFIWLNRDPIPSLEKLCQALRADPAIVGGSRIARELEEEFQSRTGYT